MAAPYRRDPEKHKADIRAANRARARAVKLLIRENQDRFDQIYASQAAAEGVTPGPSLGRGVHDLTGRVFGRLTVVEQGPNSAATAGHQTGRVRWWCRCECGERKLVKAQDLTARKVRSCGCLRTDWLAGLELDVVEVESDRGDE